MNPLSTGLLLGTRNPGKILEMRLILQPLPVKLRTLNEFDAVSTVEETGLTYDENAALKARAYSRLTGLWSIADDSGLEVDALGGGPGLFSARYAGEGASDAKRISMLLSQLRSVPDALRSARFVSVIAIADSQGALIHSAVGTCAGRIAMQPSGSSGFGYDPVFRPDSCDLTMAELSLEVKNLISHRGRALLAAGEFLASLSQLS